MTDEASDVLEAATNFDLQPARAAWRRYCSTATRVRRRYWREDHVCGAWDIDVYYDGYCVSIEMNNYAVIITAGAQPRTTSPAKA